MSVIPGLAAPNKWGFDPQITDSGEKPFLNPELPIQVAILNGFGDVLGLDVR